ncbi:hypothetical protein OG819_53375 [Streptomyces sp. NBC_01549]|uniref:hypothetical protein n=1 Tax=Streptomyces sp. NBC_01549 TaxID=2975874 RepID=UPI0022562630|nr:hypothetical protein [Streptomyces sp. NBC_01549]MCX4598002.1 hypothetical protein [Streptomyces sp. NBC_01549]
MGLAISVFVCLHPPMINGGKSWRHSQVPSVTSEEHPRECRWALPVMTSCPAPHYVETHHVSLSGAFIEHFHDVDEDVAGVQVGHQFRLIRLADGLEECRSHMCLTSR